MEKWLFLKDLEFIQYYIIPQQLTSKNTTKFLHIELALFYFPKITVHILSFIASVYENIKMFNISEILDIKIEWYDISAGYMYIC